jgi:regulator of sigma E protease
MGYVLVVATLALLILIHEAGHFVAARWAGVPVKTFSIGFGPRLWSWRRGETDYCISAIPLGGYVMLAIEDEQDFFRVPLGKRILFALGGPLANILLTVLLLTLLSILGGAANAYDILVSPLLRTWDMTVQLLNAVGELLTHPNHVSGLVGIVAYGGKAIGSDWARVLQFAAFLSLNLAVFNLLPIPVLDGGRIVLGFLEKIHPKAIQWVYMPLCVIGLVFLMSLMAYATVVDILRLLA